MFPGVAVAPLIRPAIDDLRTIQRRFEEFHSHNPWVYAALVELTRDLHRQGVDRVGVKMLFEVLRWHYIRATAGDEFRLNNSYTSRYARLIAENEPELGALFEMRKVKAP
jgi:hypothetical protein